MDPHLSMTHPSWHAWASSRLFLHLITKTTRTRWRFE